jgi:hypothetical protein
MPLSGWVRVKKTVAGTEMPGFNVPGLKLPAAQPQTELITTNTVSSAPLFKIASTSAGVDKLSKPTSFN